MLNRRRTLRIGLAGLGSLFATSRARAQRRPLAQVRYSEVTRTVELAPTYVAMGKGFFADAGLDVAMTTAYGGDKAMAALLSGAADIASMGPDAAIYVLMSDSPLKARLFCGLTATDGFMLVGREKVDKFDWSMLKGKEILGFRPGSTPLLFLQAAMRQNGVDPDKDVKLVNNVGIPARMGSWLAGQNQYAIFNEPFASQLILGGKAYFVASIGQTTGDIDHITFAATDKYIHDNPDMVQAWTDAIYHALQWTAAAESAEVAEVVAPWFSDVPTPVLTAATERCRQLKLWKTTPTIDPGPIERFQDILVDGHVLASDKRVKYADLVLTEFTSRAK